MISKTYDRYIEIMIDNKILKVTFSEVRTDIELDKYSSIFVGIAKTIKYYNIPEWNEWSTARKVEEITKVYKKMTNLEITIVISDKQQLFAL